MGFIAFLAAIAIITKVLIKREKVRMLLGFLAPYAMLLVIAGLIAFMGELVGTVLTGWADSFYWVAQIVAVLSGVLLCAHVICWLVAKLFKAL